MPQDETGNDYLEKEHRYSPLSLDDDLELDDDDIDDEDEEDDDDDNFFADPSELEEDDDVDEEDAEVTRVLDIQ